MNPNHCPKESPIWTVYFQTEYKRFGSGCYHVVYGHKKGPKLNRDLILKLATDFYKEKKEALNLKYIYCLGAGDYNEWPIETVNIVPQ